MTGESRPPVENNNNDYSERVKKQRLVRHAFEHAAALSEGSSRITGCNDPRYRRVWSHRLEQLAEMGVRRLLRDP